MTDEQQPKIAHGPIKPVWFDHDYFRKSGPAEYRPRWESVPPARFAKLALRCDKVSFNLHLARFGYLGTYTAKDGRELPRNVLCINAASTECWADMAAFP